MSVLGYSVASSPEDDGDPSSDLLESAVEAFLEGKRDRTVMVRIDRHIPQEDFGEIFMSLSNIGAEIALVGIRREE